MKFRSVKKENVSISNPMSTQSGFTLIEMLFVVAIVAILASMGVSAFYVYKEDVEYSKAEATLRNARTASSVFEIEDDSLPAGWTTGMNFSATDGSALGGDLATILPGATVSKDVRLGANYTVCDIMNNPLGLTQTIMSQPCKADRYTMFLKWCDGFEVLLHDIAMGPVC